MGVIRSLLLALSLVGFLLLAFVANVGSWAMTTFVDSDAFAATTARILDRPEVRTLLAGRLAERLTELLVPGGDAVPPVVRKGLGLTAGANIGEVRSAIQRIIVTILADPQTVSIQQDALADLHRAVLALIGTAPDDADPSSSITLDLDPVVAALDARVDPDADGFLGRSVPAGVGTLTLASPDALVVLARILHLLEALRWLLPTLCVLAASLVLLLARARLHAIAWLGLCLLLVGAGCLLAATSAPILLSRVLGTRVDTLASLEATVSGLLGGLIVQSAVLAGMGLAMLVVGVTAGMVTGRGNGREMDRGYG